MNTISGDRNDLGNLVLGHVHLFSFSLCAFAALRLCGFAPLRKSLTGKLAIAYYPVTCRLTNGRNLVAFGAGWGRLVHKIL
ncbi:MAG: hypothetical protein ACLQNE_37785 [Thermoguttaceae bacterium]